MKERRPWWSRLERPGTGRWKQHLGRAFLLAMTVGFFGSVLAQTVLWPSRSTEEDRLIVEGVAYVAFSVAFADFSIRWLLRHRRLSSGF